MVWSDERLDDLSAKVDDLRSETRVEMRALRAEMADLRAELSDARFDSMHRSLLWVMGTMALGFASIIAAQL